MEIETLHELKEKPAPHNHIVKKFSLKTFKVKLQDGY